MKRMLVSSLVRGNKFASVGMLTPWKSKEVLRKFNTIRWSFWRCLSIDATEWQNFWSGWSQSLKTVDTIGLILNGNNGNFILAFFNLNLVCIYTTRDENIIKIYINLLKWSSTGCEHQNFELRFPFDLFSWQLY